MDFTFHKVISLEQFRFQNGPDIGKRRHLTYWQAVRDEHCVIMLQQKISEKTNADMLVKAIDEGLIYLFQSDFERTKLSMENAG